MSALTFAPPNLPGNAAPTRSLAFVAAHWAAYLSAWAIVIPVEVVRWREQPPEFRSILGWFFDLNIDTSPHLLWLIVAPIFWFWPCRRGPATTDHPRKSRWRLAAICLVVGLASLANSVWIGSHFEGLPPAYHDEYSYLIQAQTFASGRLSFPSPPEAELFDQIHVLNLGKFASRYFPGTGAWMAPFLAQGHPLWGQWLASALASLLFCLAGRELAGDFAGMLTGLLISFSPGVALFSNLLLAHQPTLLGLGLFLYAWLRMMNSRSVVWSIVSGIGLTFAMLCRPLTAGAFAFPFGLWMLSQGLIAWRREGWSGFRSWLFLWTGIGIPLAFGGLLLFTHNQAITGNGWLTPYSQYTATYTPRHVFGFNNVVKGENQAGPRVMDSYDHWAENLTPELAMRNAFHRVLASGQWTLGLIPLAMALVAGIFLISRRRELWLVLAAIIMLHAVHVPYWFVGIMNWHYVFETAPLWCLWFAVVSTEILAAWRQQGRRVMVGWWCGLLVIAGLTSYVPVSGFWNQCRIGAAISEIRYPRLRYAEFSAKLNSLPPAPALVLIEGDPADRSFDLVVNEPDFRGHILRGRYLPNRVSVSRIRQLFPDRRVFLYKVRENRFSRVD